MEMLMSLWERVERAIKAAAFAEEGDFATAKQMMQEPLEGERSERSGFSRIPERALRASKVSPSV